jgi:acetoin utilization deacetylase AcuC-like enzyme
MRKYRLLREALASDGRFAFQTAPFAPRHIIEQVHDPEYVARFLTGTLETNAMRRIGFPWSEQLVRRTLASVGGTLEAARDALCIGWGGNLAGGTHHAFRGEGAGFCVFNDIAVAIAALRDDGSVERAAVLDLDVHQGDGTAKIFEDEPDVLTISIHGGNNFPFRKQAGKIDVALPDGTRDAEYLDVLQSVITRAFDFRPQVVFYQSGVDALAFDKLGRLSLTHQGLKQRDAIVFQACRAAGVPCVVTLGGGYSDPVEHTVEAHANTFRTAADIYSK